MYCRFSIISIIMLLNKSKIRTVKIKRIYDIYDMYWRFFLTKKKEALIIKTSFNYGAEGGIRTHAGVNPNGFQDRLVMTTSIPLRECLDILT